jgi:hypothetical protein
MSAECNSTPHITLPKTSSGSIGNYLRVVMIAGVLALADANDRELGVTDQNYLGSGLGQGGYASITSRHTPGTQFFTASGAISQYADVYADVLGQVSANPTGYYIGIALTATSNAGDYLEVLRVDDRGGMLYTSIGVSNVITNTVAETAFNKTAVFAPNTLKVGDFIHILAHVLCPATNSTDTLLLKLKIGATVLVATAAVDVANADIGLIDFVLCIRTVGAGGTFIGVGTQALGTPGTVTSKPVNLASTAIDTTASQTISVTATWSVANAGDQAELDLLCVNRNGG